MVAAVECAIAIQKLMGERNAGAPEDKQVRYRIGVNLGALPSVLSANLADCFRASAYMNLAALTDHPSVSRCLQQVRFNPERGKIDLRGRRTSRERAEDALDRHSPMTPSLTGKVPLAPTSPPMTEEVCWRSRHKQVFSLVLVCIVISGAIGPFCQVWSIAFEVVAKLCPMLYAEYIFIIDNPKRI